MMIISREPAEGKSLQEMRRRSIWYITLATVYILLMVGSVNSQDCKECQCYRVKCADDDKTCVSPDDLVDRSSCLELGPPCVCCLEGHCYSAWSYFCYIYQRADMLNIMFFLLIFVNYFLVRRYNSKAFGFETEIKEDSNEDDWETDGARTVFNNNEENRKSMGDKKSSDLVRVDYRGTSNIVPVQSSLDSIDDPIVKNLIASMFYLIGECRFVGEKNHRLFNTFMILLGFHIVLAFLNIAVLWRFPFPFGLGIWVSFAVQGTFLFIFYQGYYKRELYVDRIRDVLRKFEVDKKVGIAFRPATKEIHVLLLRSLNRNVGAQPQTQVPKGQTAQARELADY